MAGAVADPERVAKLGEALRDVDSYFFVIHTAPRNTNIVHASSALKTTLGFKDEDLLHKSPSVLYPGAQESDELRQLALLCGHELLSDTVIEDKEGKNHQVKVHQIPVADPAGYIILFAQVFHFVTSLEAIDSQALALEKLLQAHFQSYVGMSLKRTRALASIPHPKAYVVADCHLPDCPLVWCSPPFFEICGFTVSECIGRNCRFLQGADTDQFEVARLREAVLSLTPISSCLLNYRTDGTTFWNHVYMLPICNASGGREFFVATQYDVTRFVETASDLLLEKDRGFEEEAAMRAELQSLDDMQRDINARMRDILLMAEADLPSLPPPTIMQRMGCESWEILKTGRRGGAPVSAPAAVAAAMPPDGADEATEGDGSDAAAGGAMLNPKQANRVARARREVARRLARDWRGKGSGLTSDPDEVRGGGGGGGGGGSAAAASNMSPLRGSGATTSQAMMSPLVRAVAAAGGGGSGQSMSPLGGSTESESKPSPMKPAGA